ncbi:MAG: hypothetical protein IRD7MM_02140 [Candidatus Midichloria mitochondrii]|uniref:hypothetical protein n=1 Tax=Candidatus Midichloria mitochondrii TaxID=234827 RepID=UPI0002D6D6AD|nr:hypothetical protein [Candidatus Midichloria mitochondrii]MDJ1288603.1 hypothetical protein [Candidatus Midichloria mitochondrii]
MTPDGKDQVELNEDVIISCYPQCQKGVLFSSKTLELDRSASQQVSGNAVCYAGNKSGWTLPNWNSLQQRFGKQD